jgi:hypothetical protein
MKKPKYNFYTASLGVKLVEGSKSVKKKDLGLKPDGVWVKGNKK